MKGKGLSLPAPNPPKYPTVHTRDLAARILATDSQRGGARVISGSGSPHVPGTDPESPMGSAL